MKKGSNNQRNSTNRAKTRTNNNQRKIKTNGRAKPKAKVETKKPKKREIDELNFLQRSEVLKKRKIGEEEDVDKEISEILAEDEISPYQMFLKLLPTPSPSPVTNNNRENVKQKKRKLTEEEEEFEEEENDFEQDEENEENEGNNGESEEEVENGEEEEDEEGEGELDDGDGDESEEEEGEEGGEEEEEDIENNDQLEDIREVYKKDHFISHFYSFQVENEISEQLNNSFPKFIKQKNEKTLLGFPDFDFLTYFPFENNNNNNSNNNNNNNNNNEEEDQEESFDRLNEIRPLYERYLEENSDQILYGDSADYEKLLKNYFELNNFFLSEKLIFLLAKQIKNELKFQRKEKKRKEKEKQEKNEEKDNNNENNSENYYETKKEIIHRFSEVFPAINRYNDLLLHIQDCHSIHPLSYRYSYLFHIVNHLNKKSKVIGNNSKLMSIFREKDQKINKQRKEEIEKLQVTKEKKKKKREKLIENSEILQKLKIKEEKLRIKEQEISDKIRDQGFTKPSILIVTPMQELAGQLISKLISLIPHKQVHSLKKFKTEFLPPDRDDDQDDSSKPADANELFKGNINDCFHLGIKISGDKIKLYEDLYSSDIIVASPLGIRLLIDSPSESKGYCDFLSSIEILVIEQIDVCQMQNWAHIEYFLEHINRIPSKQRDTDFSRLRNYYFEDLAKYYRQTIITSEIITPEIKALFYRTCKNFEGKIIIQKKIEKNGGGVFHKIFNQIQQKFERIPCNNLADLSDTRFQHFKYELLPKLRMSIQNNTLIYIPSYFDYVRIRNLFKEEELSFCSCSDYTTASNISRSRTWFFHGERQFMLYTERFHFYRRYKIKGIKNIIFYGVPQYPHFYSEMVNLVDKSEGSVLLLYVDPFDALSLQRILGDVRCKRVLTSKKTHHLFISQSI